MRGEVVRIGDRPLCAAGVEAVARGRASVEIAGPALEAMRASVAAFTAAIAGGVSIYGMTCGVGGLEGISGDGAGARQRNLLRSHAAGVGAPMPGDQVRAMMLVRLANLAAGHSGVDPRVAAAIAALLNAGITPVVPSLGSVGAADLAPLAHAFLPLIGEGSARLRSGVEVGGREAMAAAGLEPLRIGGRDGLALIAGLAQTAGIAALVVADVDRLIRWSERAAALGMAAAGEVTTSLSPLAVSSKPHRGHAASAAALRAMVGDVGGSGRLRSQMSTRVAAQVAGSARELAGDLDSVLAVEINAPVDNPIAGEGGAICCNATGFDGHRLAAALDAVSGAVISLAAGAERRAARLLDPARTDLPAYLIDPDIEPALSSGLMIAQYTAAAAVAEMNATWRPVAGLSIPTANGTEDLVSMAPIAARNAARLCELARIAVATELLCAAQAADLRGAVLPEPLAEIRDAVRDRVGRTTVDRPPGPDIDTLCALMRDGD
jgi:histidine ammonia-lyase